MSDDDLPLCKKAELNIVWTGSDLFREAYIKAKDVETFLNKTFRNYSEQGKDYPLCDKAGLTVESASLHADHFELSNYPVIQACFVEKMLAMAPVVYGYWDDENIKNSQDATGWYHQNYRESDEEEWIEHQARLVMIEPIKSTPKDTTDSLLRELVKGYKACGTKQDGNEFTKDIIERARKILWEDR